MNVNMKYRIYAIVFILIALVIGAFDGLHLYDSRYGADRTDKFDVKDSIISSLSTPFKMGLDLKGGVRLVYKADLSRIPAEGIADAMDSLRNVIDRRINPNGTGEFLVQTEESGVLKSGSAKEHHLVVELPDIKNVDEAIRIIGETPSLDFRTERKDFVQTENSTVFDKYEITSLTGQYLKKARLEQNQTTFEPVIGLEFNNEGGKMFAKMTKENVGKTIAIFLDGMPLSMPRVDEEITGGSAIIRGDFTRESAKQLVQRLNSGALPVPISLISQQKVGATLGDRALKQGLLAGIYGFILIAGFLVLWYRLPGFVAVMALAIYTLLVLGIFKILSVTLTAAGIAGFILSIGMAVDANILIFERMKEERRSGKSLQAAVSEGFERAWLSIRDSNISTLISASILFWIGTSSVKGFALTLAIGVLASMFTAITVSRTFLLAVGVNREGKIAKFLFGAGLN